MANYIKKGCDEQYHNTSCFRDEQNKSLHSQYKIISSAYNSDFEAYDKLDEEEDNIQLEIITTAQEQDRQEKELEDKNHLI